MCYSGIEELTKEELMKPEKTQTNDTTISQNLYLAIELSDAQWKLGFTIGLGQAPRLRKMDARELITLDKEISLAKERFGLPEGCVVMSCYEAGRDGFWLHRYLQTREVSNLVVDSASIEVNRRFRRAKTDRMDVGKLLTMLVRYHQGEKKVWSVVNPPSVEVEDQRQLHREMMALKRERTHHINRIKGLLASQGVVLPVKADFLEQMKAVRLWNGSPLPDALNRHLLREYERYEKVQEQPSIQ
jgi:transposase